MRWKDIALIVLIVTLLNLLRLWKGLTVEWLALGGVLLLGFAVYRVRLRHWRRRVDELRDAASEETRKQLEQLPAEERAAIRVALDQVSPDDAVASPEGRVFHYPRTPTLIREYTFWGSVFIAVLAYLALVFGWDVEERPYEIALALLFTLSVGAQLMLWDRERATVRVTSSGIQWVSHDGRVSGILWREVALIRNRRLLMCVDFHSSDGRRRARVGYNLLDFAQFMELVVAHLKDVQARDAL